MFRWNDIRIYLDFLTEGQSGFWEIRILKGKPVPIDGKAQWFFKSKEEAFEWLEKYERVLLNKDIYFSLNARKEEKGGLEAVESGNNFFIDIDSEEAKKDYRKIVDVLIEFGLMPSIVSDSGHGLHLIYKIKENVNQEKWYEIEERLLEFFVENFREYKIDLQAKDMARCVRLIGTINNKAKPVQTRILLPNLNVFRLRELESILPKVKIDLFDIEFKARKGDLDWFWENIERIEKIFREKSQGLELIKKYAILLLLSEKEGFNVEIIPRLWQAFKWVEDVNFVVDWDRVIEDFEKTFGKKRAFPVRSIAKSAMLKVRKIESIAKVYLRLKRERKGRLFYIERILQTPISDGRKICILRFLVPYLANVRNLEEREALEIISDWLEKCFKLRKSNVRVSWIKSTFRNAKRKGIMPMSRERFIKEYRDLEDAKELIALLEA